MMHMVNCYMITMSVFVQANQPQLQQTPPIRDRVRDHQIASLHLKFKIEQVKLVILVCCKLFLCKLIPKYSSMSPDI